MQNWNIATWEERRGRTVNLHKGAHGTDPDAPYPTFTPEDDHRRTANDVEADRLIAARRTLLLRFLPFVLLEDQNREPADLLETVAKRLFEEARVIRRTMPLERVLLVNPHGQAVDLYPRPDA